MGSFLPCIIALLLTTTRDGAAEPYNNVTVDGALCVFPFLYKGLYYNTCVSFRSHKLWCSITNNYDRDKLWGECLDYDNVTVDGAPCVFPFLYEGLYYNTCVSFWSDKLWCSITNNYDRDKLWGECFDYDVCQSHNTLNDPWRNIGFSTTSFPDGPKNDLNLKKGWYSFTGIGGDRMVYSCPSTKSTPTAQNTTCAQKSITSLDCGGGLILYYLVPTNGLYASRHSSCGNSSCGEYAQCGLPYGSCVCKSGFSIPDAYLPTGVSYGCTEHIKDSDDCKIQFKAGCAEDVLNQIQRITATVISEKVAVEYLKKVQTSTRVLQNATTEQMELVSYGNSVLNATEKVLSMLMMNTPADFSLTNMSLETLEVQMLVIGPKTSIKTTPQLTTSSASLDIDLTEISKNNNGSAAVAFTSYSNLSDMLSPSLFNSKQDTEKTMMSSVVSATLLKTTNTQLTKPVNFTLKHIADVTPNGSLFCVYWKDTEWVVDGCQTIRIPNGTYTVCSCVHLSTFSLIMETKKVYFTANSGGDLLAQILNSDFTVLPKHVVTDILTKVMDDIAMNGASNQNNVERVNTILAATEKLVSALVTYTATYSVTPITAPNLEIQLFMVGLNASLAKIPPLDTSTASLDIDLTGIAKNNNGSAAVAFMSYTNVTNMLDPNLFITAESTEKILMSTVVSATLMKTTNKQLDTPVNFTLKHTADFKADGNISCVYWSNTKWTVDGCDLLQSNSSHSVCSCVHLSTFALIMQTKPPKNDSSFEPFNTVAVVVGLVFLSLALLTFVLCQRILRVNNNARINLCISLFLAHFLFLLTQSFLQYIQPNKLLCAVLAGVLHFLFLSAFVWMFIEAVLLFISVKNLKKIRSKQKEVLSWKYLLVVGYVIPLTVVGVSVGLFPEGYGSEQCWIKTDRDFVWSFLGPVCFILTVNLILFIAIIITLRAALVGRNSELTQMKQLRTLVFKTLIQIVILGCPWILGFFVNGSNVLMIVFLFLNSQQGTFIFLVHCVFNQEVRQQYKKWMKSFRPFFKKLDITSSPMRQNGPPSHSRLN